MRKIDPDACQFCGACVSACPVSAISNPPGTATNAISDSCIDCGACGRICAFTAVLDQHAQSCTHARRAEWLKPCFDLKLCTACGLCIQACPVSCLELYQSLKMDKTLYPNLSRADDCLACGFCVDICPVDAVRMASPNN